MARTGNPARILTSYYRPKPGGLCKRLFAAIEALLRRGHEVHYLAVERFPIDHPACHFHRFPWPKGRADGLFFWATFHVIAPPWLLALALRYRVTHAFTFSTTYALLMQPTRITLGIPLTVFLRADAIRNHAIAGRPTWLVRLETLIEGIGLTKSRLYGVSRTLTGEVLARHPRLNLSRVGTLPNNLPEQPCGDLRRPLAGAPVRMACVGVLEKRKNHRVALLTLQGLPPRDAQLTLFGSGPLESYLKQLAEEIGVIERTHFAGWKPPREIWPEVDLLLFPSTHEGAPNAVLEALAAGVPVLASDTPEHREILPAEDLLPSGNIPAWTHAVRRLLGSENAVRGALVDRQRRFAERLRFDWSEAIQGLILHD